MSYTNHSFNTRQPRRKLNNKWLWLVIALLIIVILVVFLLKPSKKSTHQLSQNNQTPVSDQLETNLKTQKPQLKNIQSTIDDFIASNPGEYGIKISDINGKSLAEINADKQFFAASIYKLFVAYVGYQQIDNKTSNKDDPYLTGYTRWQCLDAMIRDSYSPCAEKMWNELGKQNITDKMKQLGLTNTSLTGVTTTANDTSIILQKIAKGQDLSKESQEQFLDSMKTQDSKYRRGLPAGFKQAIVFNKVGWNLSEEWHDASIVKLANNQTVVVAVLTSGVGYKVIAELGGKIEQALE